MLILVRPHVSLLDGPAVARFLPKAGIWQSVFAVDPDYARHPVWSRLLNAYGWRAGGHTMLPLDATRPFAMRELLRILDQGRDVVIFPQGTGIGDSARPDAGGCGWLLERVASCMGTAGEVRTSRRVVEITLSHETRWPRIERFDELLPCSPRPTHDDPPRNRRKQWPGPQQDRPTTNQRVR